MDHPKTCANRSASNPALNKERPFPVAFQNAAELAQPGKYGTGVPHFSQFLREVGLETPRTGGVPNYREVGFHERTHFNSLFVVSNGRLPGGICFLQRLFYSGQLLSARPTERMRSLLPGLNSFPMSSTSTRVLAETTPPGIVSIRFAGLEGYFSGPALRMSAVPVIPWLVLK
jgi:hypothetical protein